jgi:16S rRNA (guanine1207-N2)-methyltransferase
VGTTPDRTDHYFAENPDAASRRRTVDLTLPDITLHLTTDSGVFAGDAVDSGTKYLLAEGPLVTRDRAPSGDAASEKPPTIVDLGCGYGPIAVTLARRHPDATIWAVDVNRRALDLTAENAAANDVAVVTMTPAEVPEGSVDEIWSNPPIRIGKAALHELLATWIGRLTPDGRALLVVNRNLGADSLAKWMTGRGWSVERVGSRQGYRILEVRP